MEMKEITFTPKTYLVWRKEIEIKNIMDQNMWQTAFGKVHEYIRKNNLKITGPGAAIYFRWNEPEGKGEIGIGNPVENVHEVNDPDLALVPVAESNAIVTTVHGRYETFPQHHAELMKYLRERNKKETLTIEEYMVTGMDKPDPQNWETNIYHLYE
jgi:effector-binding domain-containing protein